MAEISDAARRHAWGEMTESELKSAYNASYEKYKVSSTKPGPDGVVRTPKPFPSYEEWKAQKLEIYRITNTAQMEVVTKVIAKAPEKDQAALVKEAAKQVIAIAEAPVQVKKELEDKAVDHIVQKAEETKPKTPWGTYAAIAGALSLPFIFR